MESNEYNNLISTVAGNFDLNEKRLMQMIYSSKELEEIVWDEGAGGSEELCGLLVFCLENLESYSEINKELSRAKASSRTDVNSGEAINLILSQIKRNISMINSKIQSIFDEYEVKMTFQTERAYNIPVIGIYNNKLTTSLESGFSIVLFFDIYSRDMYISLYLGENKAREDYSEMKEFLSDNINEERLNAGDKLEALDRYQVNRSDYYSASSIVCKKLSLGDLDEGIYMMIKGYLDEADRLIQMYLADGSYEGQSNFIEQSDITNFEVFNTYETCNVEFCNKAADYAVFILDSEDGSLSHDSSCRYICKEHMIENEVTRFNIPSAKVGAEYLFTSKTGRNGITKYLPLEIERTINLKILPEYAEKDCLETLQEVNVLYDLIVSDAVQMPLNIGIFGDWGSGKTFFINELGKKLNKLNHEQRGTSAPLVVNFNAWNYYDSNIIVSLVYKIFGKIQERYEIKDNSFIKEFEHYKIYSQKKRADEKEKLKDQIDELKCKKNREDKEIVSEVFSELSLEGELKGVKKLGVALKYMRTNRYGYVGLAIAVCLWLLSSKFGTEISGFMKGSGLCTALLGYVSIYKKFSGIIDQYGEKIDNQNKLQSSIDSLVKKYEALDEAQSTDMSLDYMKEFIIDKLNHEGYKNNLGFIATVKKDIDKLKKVLENLNAPSCSNERKKGFKEIDKIVLLVDDLDRCPEDKVVDVLQSIQLLLATKLFVVIIAVDTKWINKCIVSQYDQMLKVNNGKNENFFAINYLEKIIHMPFWLRKMSYDNTLDFIKKVDVYNEEVESIRPSDLPSNNQPRDSEINIREKYTPERDYLEGSKNGREIREFYQIDQGDIDNFEEFKFLFENISPRRTKRFLNTMLLIKNSEALVRYNFNLVTFICASIVLKSEWTCRFYNYICCEELEKAEGDFTKGVFKMYLKFWKGRPECSKLERGFWEAYGSFVDDLKEDKFGNIKGIISEVSRFTYYHEEIMQSMRPRAVEFTNE